MSLFIGPGEFGQSDFVVTWREADGRAVKVGRMFKINTRVPNETPWVWTIDFFQRAGRPKPHRGRCATQEAAWAAWQQCWESADVPVRWTPAFPPL